MLKKQYLKGKPVCKVTFTLPKEAATEAKEVKVLGDFNDWSWENGHLMKASKGEFKTVIELETGRDYEFRYLIDNATWENDWAADGYVQTPFGVDNSIVSIDGVVAEPTVKKAAPKKKASTAKKPAAAKKTTSKKTTATKKTTTKKPTAKTKSGKDDLKKIEGIGPKIEQLLNKGGITTFADLVKAKKTEVKSILEAAGSRYKMHDPTTWSKQAKLAEKGDWDNLAKLQDELKGGKKK